MMPGGKNAARIIVERGVTGHWWVNSGKPTFGIYNWFTNTIHLHEGAYKSLKEFADTYFHELAHYANDIAQFIGDLTPPTEAWWPSIPTKSADTRTLSVDGNTVIQHEKYQK